MSKLDVDDIYSQTNKGKAIFEYYLGHEIAKNTRYLAVLREERNPSMTFYVSANEGWRMKDFGAGNIGPIEFVMLKFNMTFPDAKDKVVKDLSLTEPEFKRKQFSDAPVRPVIKEEIKQEEDKFLIKFEALNEWSKQDVEFWSKYGIETELLEEYKINPISQYTILYADISRKPVTIKRSKENPLIYAYELTDVTGARKVKIYCPVVSKREFKWIGNSTKDTIQGLPQLKKDKPNLIICSSMKDFLTLYCLFGSSRNFECIAGNSETTMISGDIITALQSHYKKVFTFLDWDDAGKRFTEIYEARYRIKGLNDLLRDMNVKDIAEVQEYCDQEEITGFIKEIKDILR